nr:MAG TPA: hypothetical protein [Caudoviricetes sp.]
MAPRHSNPHASIPHPVSAHRNTHVMLQRQVNTSIILIRLTRMSRTIIKRIKKQFQKSLRKRERAPTRRKKLQVSLQKPQMKD